MPKKNQTLAVSVKRFKNSEMQKKKSFETEIALRDLGFNSFSWTSKCCQFHFFTTILSRPRMMVFLPLSLHACTCSPRPSLCCCNLRWRSLSEIILPMISVVCQMLSFLCLDVVMADNSIYLGSGTLIIIIEIFSSSFYDFQCLSFSHTHKHWYFLCLAIFHSWTKSFGSRIMIVIFFSSWLNSDRIFVIQIIHLSW